MADLVAALVALLQADTALAAPKLAAALFKDFPGQSGETIVVQ